MKRKLLALLTALTMLFLFVGCGAKNDTASITVSEVTHSIFYAPQYAAIELGYFAEEGIDLELVNGGGADTVMTSVISGDAEIGFAGPEATIYVYNEGREDHAVVFAQMTKTSEPSFAAHSFTVTTWGRESSSLPISSSLIFAA